MHVSDSTDGSFVLTKRLIAPSAPKVVSRAGVDTIRNPPLDTRAVPVTLGVTTMRLPGTITGAAGTGVDTIAGTTMPLVVPLATVRVVMAAVAMVCFTNLGDISTILTQDRRWSQHRIWWRWR
jgi:hypothetical protein